MYFAATKDLFKNTASSLAKELNVNALSDRLVESLVGHLTTLAEEKTAKLQPTTTVSSAFAPSDKKENPYVLLQNINSLLNAAFDKTVTATQRENKLPLVLVDINKNLKTLVELQTQNKEVLKDVLTEQEKTEKDSQPKTIIDTVKSFLAQDKESKQSNQEENKPAKGLFMPIVKGIEDAQKEWGQLKTFAGSFFNEQNKSKGLIEKFITAAKEANKPQEKEEIQKKEQASLIRSVRDLIKEETELDKQQLKPKTMLEEEAVGATHVVVDLFANKALEQLKGIMPNKVLESIDKTTQIHTEKFDEVIKILNWMKLYCCDDCCCEQGGGPRVPIPIGQPVNQPFQQPFAIGEIIKMALAAALGAGAVAVATQEATQEASPKEQPEQVPATKEQTEFQPVPKPEIKPAKPQEVPAPKPQERPLPKPQEAPAPKPQEAPAPKPATPAQPPIKVEPVKPIPPAVPSEPLPSQVGVPTGPEAPKPTKPRVTTPRPAAVPVPSTTTYQTPTTAPVVEAVPAQSPTTYTSTPPAEPVTKPVVVQGVAPDGTVIKGQAEPWSRDPDHWKQKTGKVTGEGRPTATSSTTTTTGGGGGGKSGGTPPMGTPGGSSPGSPGGASPSSNGPGNRPVNLEAGAPPIKGGEAQSTSRYSIGPNGEIIETKIPTAQPAASTTRPGSGPVATAEPVTKPVAPVSPIGLGETSDLGRWYRAPWWMKPGADITPRQPVKLPSWIPATQPGGALGPGGAGSRALEQAGKWGSKLKPLKPLLGPLATGVAVAGEGYGGYQRYQEKAAEIDQKYEAGEITDKEAGLEKSKATGKEIAGTTTKIGSGLAGAAAGAVTMGAAGTMAGATIGSVIPIVGTVAGGVIGGIGGSILGAIGGYSRGQELAEYTGLQAGAESLGEKIGGAMDYDEDPFRAPKYKEEAEIVSSKDELVDEFGFPLHGIERRLKQLEIQKEKAQRLAKKMGLDVDPDKINYETQGGVIVSINGKKVPDKFLTKKERESVKAAQQVGAAMRGEIPPTGVVAGKSESTKASAFGEFGEKPSPEKQKEIDAYIKERDSDPNYQRRKQINPQVANDRFKEEWKRKNKKQFIPSEDPGSKLDVSAALDGRAAVTPEDSAKLDGNITVTPEDSAKLDGNAAMSSFTAGGSFASIEPQRETSPIFNLGESKDKRFDLLKDIAQSTGKTNETLKLLTNVFGDFTGGFAKYGAAIERKLDAPPSVIQAPAMAGGPQNPGVRNSEIAKMGNRSQAQFRAIDVEGSRPIPA